jgi:hypothetical protein
MAPGMRVENPSILGPEAGLVTGEPLSDGATASPQGTARAQRTPAVAGSFFASELTFTRRFPERASVLAGAEGCSSCAIPATAKVSSGLRARASD